MDFCHRCVSVGRPEITYSHQLCEDTRYRREVFLIGTDYGRERESKDSVLLAHLMMIMVVIVVRWIDLLIHFVRVFLNIFFSKRKHYFHLDLIDLAQNIDRGILDKHFDPLRT